MSFEDFDAAVLASEERDRVFFIVTHGWMGGAVRAETFLHALFISNPRASVFFVASTPVKPATPVFSALLDRGYAIRGIHATCDVLQESGWWLVDRNRAWLRANCGNPAAEFFYTHLTDYLRFALLHHYGGAYTDTDSIFFQRIPAEEFAGLDKGTDPRKVDMSKVRVPWFVDPVADLYAAPGVMRLAKGSAVAADVLSSVFDPAVYDPQCFDCVGPRAFNLALATSADAHRLTLFETVTFYPLPFYATGPLFSGRGVGAPQLFVEGVRRSSVALHLFGGMTRHAAVESGSVVSHLHSSLNFVPPPRGAACTFAGSSVLVVRGNSDALVAGNLVFLRDCAPLVEVVRGESRRGRTERKAFLELSVEEGRLDVDGQPAGAEYRSVPLVSLAHVNQLLAATRYTAGAAPPGGSYYDGPATDTLHLSVVARDGESESVLASAALPVLVFNRLVTVMTHTNGRASRVGDMYESLQRFFPGTQLLASDDSVDGASGEVEQRGAFGPEMRWIPVPLDSGLSLARNTLLGAARTRFVQLLDDDFTLGPKAHLGLLLAILFRSGFDIASPVIPADIEKFVHYRGFISATPGGDLKLEYGHYGEVEGCLHVDFVPNVFLGVRASLVDVGWDPEFKLGEHEDFFLRAKDAGLRVLSCDHVEVTHKQDKWWDKERPGADAEYSDRRLRVFEYFRRSLRKHGLKRLNSFGLIQATVE